MDWRKCKCSIGFLQYWRLLVGRFQAARTLRGGDVSYQQRKTKNSLLCKVPSQCKVYQLAAEFVCMA